MSKSTLSLAGPQCSPALVSCLWVTDGSEGAWLVCAHHQPTGRRFLLAIAAASGDSALELAKSKTAELDPFGSPDDWRYSVEFYDVDAVVAMQCDDTVEMDLPIPFTPTPQLAPQDLELYHQVDAEDLFWPERAAELRK